MAVAPPRLPRSPPALPDELVEEILLRLPPDEPKWLLRASVVSKTWGGAISHHGFRRRLHELHRTPPVLGFLHNWKYKGVPRFIPTTASAFSLAAPSCRFWRALDCRHGRALFLSKGQDASNLLLLWDPITGSEQRVLVPAAFAWSEYRHGKISPTAAVCCAADGCDHRDCHGGPFFIVFLFSVEDDTDQEYVTSACVYSSETDMWGELTSRHCDEDAHFTYYSSVIVESSLLYFMCDNGRIQEYDLESRSLNVFDGPDRRKRSNLVLAEDGGLGLIQDFDPQLKLWSRVKSDGTDARWVLSRVIILENLLQNGALQEGSVHVLGFAEGANVIFVTTPVGLFTIELQSQRVRRVCDDHGFCNLIPVVGFYIPVHGGEHQPLSSPSEEAGGEEGEEEEKTIDQAQQLLDKGSNVIKEGGFVNAFECVSHDLNIRVPRYGEGALEGASMLNKHGCALVSKDSWGDDPKSAGNEELVKRTSSKDDVKNSLTSGSNFDSAPSSEKDLEQRILKQQDAEERKRQLKDSLDIRWFQKEQACQSGAEDIEPDVDALMSFRGLGTSKK